MPRDIEKVRAARRRWYDRNKQHAKAMVRERLLEQVRWWAEFKATQKCVDCGESHPACLEFHHTSKDKEKHLANAVRSGWSREKILAEVAKCVCVCANCHRKRHWNGKRLVFRSVV